MKLPEGCRERVFYVGSNMFWVLGNPGTDDERTAFGFRRKYAPGAEIEAKWIVRGS